MNTEELMLQVDMLPASQLFKAIEPDVQPTPVIAPGSLSAWPPNPAINWASSMVLAGHLKFRAIGQKL